MKTDKTILVTEAVFSDDGTKRYLLRKLWDKNAPKLAIIMLAPSEASGIVLDTTTQLVLNNAARLGYGSVDILNLFATLNDFSLKLAEAEDPVNLETIVTSVSEADVVVYASGVGKASNKTFQKRQEQVLNSLRPYETKLNCLTDANGKARLQHPLSPAVRTWHLSPLQISELLSSEPGATEKSVEKKPQRRGRKAS